VNRLDEAYLEWLTAVYADVLAEMPMDQKLQIEAAFYAGASNGILVVAQHGEEQAIEGVKAHIERYERDEVLEVN
jgi:hypothetical protein